VSWLSANVGRVLASTGTHLQLALLPVLVGLVLAIPLGALANRSGVARAVLVPGAGILYTIPSLALFVVLPGILGTRILDPVNVVVALSIYAVALLVRSVADALAAVPGHVTAAATAMGYRPLRRFLAVELPLAVPVLVAGLRVVTVTSISLVSVGALIGVGGLGELFTEGFQRNIPAEIVTGIVCSLVLAVLADALLLLAGRVLTPWSRAGPVPGRPA